MTSDPSPRVAIVVIGRNEGERLKSCLRTVLGRARTVVYVDSGSSDGSPQYAASVGCRVVELDPARLFSAARGRNEGFDCVVEHDPDAVYIQFLDGDCDLMEGWLEQGMAVLDARADVAIVCGHVRELDPQGSIYNRLCDLEWRQPVGEIRTSGGRFMVRAEVYRAVGGFRPDVIAAEDDEFCIRVRAQGWKILQVDAEMARHDMAMMHFGEWWRRAQRTGHAYAHVAALHGGNAERYFVHDRRKIWFWGLILPLLALTAAPFTHGLSLAVALVAYTMQFVRIYGHGRKRGWKPGDAALHSFFVVISRMPALQGVLAYHWRSWRGAGLKIIEYRGTHDAQDRSRSNRRIR